jgi:NAD(P)-dependent dehydrogenase (short-subunit alcohol dehydrogenase family)
MNNSFGLMSALVTGGASGIGQAVAEMLAERGHPVAVADVSLGGASNTLMRIREKGGTAIALELDVRDEQSVLDGFAAARSAFTTTPQLVVSCAGILHFAPAIETSIADFDRVLGVNLRGTFLVSTTAARALADAELPGSIVNVSSIHAVLSEPNASSYTASKGGVEAMSRTFATEWASKAIRVNCVRPGATITALTADIYSQEVLNALAQRIPLKRPATPREIAEGIIFLLSDSANYITGTTLDIDGGYVMNGALPAADYMDAASKDGDL